MSATSARQPGTGRLAEAVRIITRHRNITMREVAAETGLPPSTLTRLSQGQRPDADALVSLLAWLRADAAEYTITRPEVPGG